MRKLFTALAAFIVIFLIVAALQPADFRIARSATLAASPSAIYEQISNFQKWNAWSPWAKLDPNAKNTISEPPAGVGASFAWSGNSKVGEGRMTITETKINERVVMKLEFTKPFTATNTAEFVLVPKNGQTEVTWSMSGRNGFVGKVAALAMNADKMVGGKLEEGFANLKTVLAGKP